MDRAAANAFDPATNPTGIINLGTAENKVGMGEGGGGALGGDADGAWVRTGVRDAQLMMTELLAKVGRASDRRAMLALP